MPESLLKRLYYRFFSVNFLKFVGPLFLQGTFGRLLLYLEPCQVSTIEDFCGKSKSLTVFVKKPMLYVYEVSNHALLAASFQALIQDFVREGGWLAPKIFQGAQRRKTFLGLF